MRFRAKWVPLVLVASLFLFVSLLSITVFAQTSASVAVPAADEQQVADLPNEASDAAGLTAPASDATPPAPAKIKTLGITSNNNFCPTSPAYGSQFDMMKADRAQYSYAGKNTDGSSTRQGAYTCLMNSSGNCASILNTGYTTKMGIDVVRSDVCNKAFVKLFIKPTSTIPTLPQKPVQPQKPAQPQEPAQPQTPEPAPDTSGLNADEQAMFDLVNQERSKAGLRPLQVDMTLVRVARLKAQDMINKGYFSHTSPTYGSPFDMLKTYGVQYSYAGENLAGAPTVQSAHNNLMNSSGHRANILNASYTKVGIGVVSGGPYGKMFVQMFTG